MAWKIIFERADKSKTEMTNKVKGLDLRLAEYYNDLYGKNCVSKIVRFYPFKDNEPMDLDDYIKNLNKGEKEYAKGN